MLRGLECVEPEFCLLSGPEGLLEAAQKTFTKTMVLEVGGTRRPACKPPCVQGLALSTILRRLEG